MTTEASPQRPQRFDPEAEARRVWRMLKRRHVLPLVIWPNPAEQIVADIALEIRAARALPGGAPPMTPREQIEALRDWLEKEGRQDLRMSAEALRLCVLSDVGAVIASWTPEARTPLFTEDEDGERVRTCWNHTDYCAEHCRPKGECDREAETEKQQQPSEASSAERPSPTKGAAAGCDESVRETQALIDFGTRALLHLDARLRAKGRGGQRGVCGHSEEPHPLTDLCADWRASQGGERP
jgi:hypothetical protein